jgi:hypothetical protein
MAEFHAAEAATPGERRAHPRVHGAVFDQLYDFVPDGAIAALVQRDGDNAPTIVAYHHDQLYILELLDSGDEISQPPTRCRMFHLTPGNGAVEVVTRYRSRQADVAARGADWHFELEGGTSLTIETYMGPDGEVEDREALAQAIARALGWEMDLPVTEVAVEAA